MTFTIQIDFRQFLLLMFRLTYRKAIILFLTAIGLLSLVAGIGALTGIVPNSTGNALLQLVFGLFFTGVFPLVLYWSVRKGFRTNAFFREPIEFRIEEGRMNMKGTNYAFAIELDNVTRVRELKQWFVVYQRRVTLCPIPKTQLSFAEIEELRNIFKGLKHAKVRTLESGS